MPWCHRVGQFIGKFLSCGVRGIKWHSKCAASASAQWAMLQNVDVNVTRRLRWNCPPARNSLHPRLSPRTASRERAWAPVMDMPRASKPPTSSNAAPAALATPATKPRPEKAVRISEPAQAATWAPSWATSNTPASVRSPSTKKNGTSPSKTRIREASEESEYEYVYSDVPADAPLDNMRAGFPGEKSVGVAVTPQGKELESPSEPGSTDSTYVAPSWTFGAAALRPSHDEGATQLRAKAAAGGAESPYEYYSYDEEYNEETSGRAAFPQPPGHTPSTAQRSPGKGRKRLDNAHGVYDSAANSSTGAAVAKPSFWSQVTSPVKKAYTLCLPLSRPRP